MIVQMCIYVVVFLFAAYYFTIGLHVFGFKVFSQEELEPKHVVKPFYYWFKNRKELVEDVSFDSKLKKAEEAVESAKVQVERLTSEADQESSRAKKDLSRARKMYKKSKENLDLLKKTNFK